VTKDFILALDFDGVLWDSAGECFFIAREAWEALEGPLPRISEAAFRRGRWLVRTGGEFGLILWLLREDPERDLEAYSTAAFESLAQAQGAFLRRFEVEFYTRRERFRNQDPQAWQALQSPHPAMSAEWAAVAESFREVVVCTTKNEAAIRALLGSAGLQLPVLAREFSVDKRDQMAFLAATRDVPASQILFVDDLLRNLEPVGEMGVRVALAGWGYNTAAEQARARELGIPVLRAGRILEGLRELARD